LLEAALSLDPGRSAVRNRLADVLYDRVQWAEQTRDGELERELRARLPAYDVDGTRRRRLDAPAHITLRIEPATTVATVQRYGPGSPGFQASVRRPVAASVDLPPGSSLFSFEAGGHAPVRLPALVRPDEPLALSVSLPKADAVPDGFAYVPAGRFLFGC